MQSELSLRELVIPAVCVDVFYVQITWLEHWATNRAWNMWCEGVYEQRYTIALWYEQRALWYERRRYNTIPLSWIDLLHWEMKKRKEVEVLEMILAHTQWRVGGPIPGHFRNINFHDKSFTWQNTNNFWKYDVLIEKMPLFDTSRAILVKFSISENTKANSNIWFSILFNNHARARWLSMGLLKTRLILVENEVSYENAGKIVKIKTVIIFSYLKLHSIK